MEFEIAKRRFDTLMGNMQEYRSEWEDISKYMCPARGKFDDSEPKRNEIDYKKFINSTAAQALDTMASGLQAGIASPNRQWFTFRSHPRADSFETISDTIHENTDINKYLSYSREEVEGVFANSNVYQSLRIMFEDAAAFGTGTMIVDEDDTEVVHCNVMTCGEYALANGLDGRADTLCRYIYKTTADLMSEFEEKLIPEAIREQYENGKFDEWHKVCHMITPNYDVKISPTSKGKSWLSLYWLDEGGEGFLKEAGYKRNPIISLRWSKTTTADIYGVGVGGRILGDLRQLAKLEQDKCLAVDLLTFPPVQVNTSVQGKINLNPKGITRYVGNEPAVNPVERMAMDLNALQNSINELQMRIERAFYKDIFVMIMQATREKTAYEVDALLSEKMLMIGPLYENIKYEVLLPLLSYTFNAAISIGRIPDPPEDFDEDIDIDFFTMVSQAQRSSSLTNQNAFVSALIQYADRFPEALDNVLIDKVIINIGDKLGVDGNLFRTKNEREKLRTQRQQAQQQSAMLDNAQREANIQKTRGEAENAFNQAGSDMTPLSMNGMEQD